MTADITKKLVIVASSTGGPKALHQLIPGLAKTLDAAVIIVQHMPKGFTASLAERLDQISEISVSEARNGENIKKGHVYLAKGGTHLCVDKDSLDRLILREDDSDPVNGLRPYADITFNSVVSLSVDSVICVVLTGMGEDGYAGIKNLKNRRSVYTIAQDKESCVVYGMPRAVVENGLADIVLPLEQISKEIMKKVGVCEHGFKSIS